MSSGRKLVHRAEDVLPIFEEHRDLVVVNLDLRQAPNVENLPRVYGIPSCLYSSYKICRPLISLPSCCWPP